MRSLAAAWIAGMAIVIWRDVHRTHQMPVPGQLAGVTGLFAVLALLADLAPPMATPIGIAAWGLDVAALLDALPAGLSGQITTSAKAESGPQASPATA